MDTYKTDEADAIPVSWILAYIEENFWVRGDVLKLIDAWHEYVKANGKGGHAE